MLILTPGANVAANEAKLVAAMLKFEHGAVVRDPSGVTLDPPHAKFPTVAVSPITTRGASCSVHYRPTVGVVFYTSGAMIGGASEFNIGNFVRRVSVLLADAGDAHLRSYRAVAATPATVMRHRGRVSGSHLVVGPRKCFRKPIVEKSNLRSRLLQWVPSYELEPPPHFSICAAFTWVFMPVTVAIAIRSFNSMSEVNAMLASVFYDGGNLCQYPDGSVVERISMADFVTHTLPEWLVEERTRSVKVLGNPRAGCLVVRPSTGSIEYVGRYHNLHCTPQLTHELPELAPWDPDSLHATEGGCYQCVSCGVPIGGTAVIIRDARVAAGAIHRNWFYNRLNAGTRLHQPSEANKGYILCSRCWSALESPACVTEHMGARVERTVIPGTQADACAKCPGYEVIGRILAGCVSRTDVPGAFTVDVEGARFVITGQKLGEFPLLTCAGVAALKLAVVPYIRIAEDPS